MNTSDVLATVQAELRQRLVDLRGTPAFADALTERERALGLAAPASPASSASPVSTETPETPETPETAGQPEQPGMPDQDVTRHDRHGNTILGAPGRYGQYRIVSARDGRVLRICGEAATTKHLVMWEYHTGERRYVCAICWPEPNS